MSNYATIHTHPYHGIGLKQPLVIAACALLAVSPLFSVIPQALSSINSKETTSLKTPNSNTSPNQSKLNTKSNKSNTKNNTSKADAGSAAAAKGQTAAQPQTAAPVAATAPPAPAPSTVWHSTTATKFWVGEAAGPDNGYIDNLSSAWTTDWVGAFGGVDDPNNRCGYNPCAFTPNENPFYAALPYGDYTESGQKSNLNVIPWFSGYVPDGASILKNHWIAVSANGKTVYVQWEDVGPFNDDDHGYVFGNSNSAYHAGLDLSPAAMDYLGIGGLGTVAWRFVDSSDVPAGPWTNITTSSPPNW